MLGDDTIKVNDIDFYYVAEYDNIYTAEFNLRKKEKDFAYVKIFKHPMKEIYYIYRR